MIHYKNLGLAVLINAFFIVLCLGFSHLRYGAIDDYFMAGLLSGMYGNDYNVHLIFVNAVYGYMLLPLYHLFPQISWYYIGELASIFISLTLIVYFIMYKVGRDWGIILGAVLVAIYAKDLYVVLQFTQCAVVLTTAGVITLIYAFEMSASKYVGKRWILAAVSFGIFLLWWGSFMRWEAFLMGIPFFITTIILWTKDNAINNRFVLIVLLTTLLGALVFHQFNQSLYQSPEYKQFTDFQPFRVLLGDGSFYNEQAVYEDLQEMNESSEDFALLKKWFFYDNEVFSPERMKTIESLIQKNIIKQPYSATLTMLIQQLTQSAHSPIFIVWVMFGIILLISNKTKSFYLWISLFLFLAAMVYLLSVNRIVYRVQLGLIFYATVMTTVFWKFFARHYTKILYGMLIIFLGVASWIYYDTRNIFHSPNDGGMIEMEKVLSGKGYSELFQYMNSTPDSVLFLTPMDTYMNFAEHRLPPYLNESMGSWQRIIPSGYWTPYYPDVETAFRKRGMKNPMKDIVKDNVFFISDVKFKTSLVNYLQEHYFDSVRVDTVECFGDVSVLKYSVIKEKQ